MKRTSGRIDCTPENSEQLKTPEVLGNVGFSALAESDSLQWIDIVTRKNGNCYIWLGHQSNVFKYHFPVLLKRTRVHKRSFGILKSKVLRSLVMILFKRCLRQGKILHNDQLVSQPSHLGKCFWGGKELPLTELATINKITLGRVFLEASVLAWNKEKTVGNLSEEIRVKK